LRETRGQEKAAEKKGKGRLEKAAREKSNLLNISLDLFEKMTRGLDVERVAGILSMSLAGNLGLGRVAVFSLGLEENGFYRSFSLGTGPGFKPTFIDYVKGFVKWVEGRHPPAHLDNFFTSGAGVTVEECFWLEDFINEGFAHVSTLKAGGKVTALVFYGGRLSGSAFEGYSEELLRSLLRTGSAAMSAALIHRTAMARFREIERFASVKESNVTRNSFELNTPLTVLKSALWSIDSETAAEGLMVDMAKDALDDLEARINELASISELRRDGANMRLEVTDISSMIEEILRGMLPEIEEKRITVDFNERTPREIRLDSGKMRISVSAILSEAVKSIPRGGKMKVSVRGGESGPEQSEGAELDQWRRAAVPGVDLAFLDSVGKDEAAEEKRRPWQTPEIWLETRISTKAVKGPLQDQLGSLLSEGASVEKTGSGLETGGDKILLALKIISDHGGRVFVRNDLETEGEWELSIWLPGEM